MISQVTGHVIKQFLEHNMIKTTLWTMRFPIQLWARSAQGAFNDMFRKGYDWNNLLKLVLLLDWICLSVARPPSNEPRGGSNARPIFERSSCP
jgi:hypothetical protein